MTKATSKTPQVNRKQKNPKFRVHPGLGMTGKELRSRIKNGSIKLTEGTEYSLDTTYQEVSNLSKAEIANLAARNQEKIDNTKRDIENRQKERDRKDRNELNEYRKNNPKT